MVHGHIKANNMSKELNMETLTDNILRMFQDPAISIAKSDLNRIADKARYTIEQQSTLSFNGGKAIRKVDAIDTINIFVKKVEQIFERPAPKANGDVRLYDIWIEGYAITGNDAQASFLGQEYGRNFKEACHVYMCKRYLQSQAYQGEEAGRWDYNANTQKEWGCQLYETEEEARKSFG